MNAGTIFFQTIFQTFFYRAVIAVFLHIDEIDDEKTGKIAEPALPRDFFGGFKIGL